MATPKPDYLSRDFAGLRASMLSYAGQVFPEWQPSSEGDLGMVMLELFAYMGDIQSYYTDRAQFENYLSTATQRDSVLALAYLLGYVPNSGAPARGTVSLLTSSGVSSTVVPAGTQIATGRIEEIDGPVIFETDFDVTLSANGSATSVVEVTEGSSERFVKIGESTGLPSQTFVLPHVGVYRDTIRVYIEDGTGTTTIYPGGSLVQAREWLQEDHLLDTGELGQRFEVQYADRAVYVNFGDDINGAIPATGLQIFASYRHGAGASGNVAAGQVRLINSTTISGISVERDDTSGVYDSSVMTGGADPESTESIRYNAPRAYRTQKRAVTKQDYRDLAVSVEGVSKANVVAGTFTSVTAYISGPDGGAPSTSLQNRVSDVLTERSMTGVTVSVASPGFVDVDFGSVSDTIDVAVDPRYSNAVVRAAVERAIRVYVAGLTFEDDLTAADVYQRTMDVEGVRNVYIPVITRADAVQTGVFSIEPRPWELFKVRDIHLYVYGGVA